MQISYRQRLFTVEITQEAFQIVINQISLIVQMDQPIVIIFTMIVDQTFEHFTKEIPATVTIL